jgi:D-2-hydroxyacid dehydrogenase (NADP+)
MFLNFPLPDDWHQKLQAVSPQITLITDPKAWHDEIPNLDAIFGSIGTEDLSLAKNLRWIQYPAAGVEGLMYPSLINSNIILTNAQGCFAPQIAEHAFGLLFGLTRHIAHHALERKWAQQTPWPIDLRGKTMGIIGLGGIGRQIARRAKAFDLRVIAVDAEPMFGEKFSMVDRVTLVDEGLDDLLKESDIVVCSAPITARTHGLLGEKQFALMKDGAYFINVSRGKIVQTDALLAAIRNKKLAGAGVDVTDPEPLPDDHPLWQEPNVIVTPHIAGQTQPGYDRTYGVLLENTRRFTTGLPMLNRVDKIKGY